MPLLQCSRCRLAATHVGALVVTTKFEWIDSLRSRIAASSGQPMMQRQVTQQKHLTAVELAALAWQVGVITLTTAPETEKEMRSLLRTWEGGHGRRGGAGRPS